MAAGMRPPTLISISLPIYTSSCQSKLIPKKTFNISNTFYELKACYVHETKECATNFSLALNQNRTSLPDIPPQSLHKRQEREPHLQDLEVLFFEKNQNNSSILTKSFEIGDRRFQNLKQKSSSVMPFSFSEKFMASYVYVKNEFLDTYN
ncbi:UNVERIFIED_CONTAM: hypothetical protein NCL1_12484 [Trichonephila clavipes]